MNDDRFKLSLEEVERCVEAIREMRSDYEAAHSKEDELYAAVLNHIAVRCKDSACRELARAAIKTADIDFERHCA